MLQDGCRGRRGPFSVEFMCRRRRRTDRGTTNFGRGPRRRENGRRRRIVLRRTVRKRAELADVSCSHVGADCRRGGERGERVRGRGRESDATAERRERRRPVRPDGDQNGSDGVQVRRGGEETRVDICHDRDGHRDGVRHHVRSVFQLLRRVESTDDGRGRGDGRQTIVDDIDDCCCRGVRENAR